MPDTDFEFAHTRAAQMLREAIAQKRAEGKSLRDLARKLSYRQSTVLSHMANGRVGVPLSRAVEMARVFGLPAAEFARAVSEQRSGSVFTQAMMGDMPDSEILPLHGDHFLNELEEIAGRELRHLTEEQKRVLREVVVDPRADRRWVALAELPTLSLLRDLRPGMREAGLSPAEKAALRRALNG
jgi:transcriptional regulator with XRE-family HTH domain